MPEKIAIGVDIGGTHISCAAVDLLNQRILDQTMISKVVDNQAASELILEAWADALQECIDKLPGAQFQGIGFAMPGPFDYESGIALFQRVKKFESLYGLNITHEFYRRLHLPTPDPQPALSILHLTSSILHLPFRYINDATAFAMGETWCGAGSQFNRVVALTLGTGFGSAFLENGSPVTSGNEVPKDGCMWYLPFGDAIADDFLSVRWFEGEYKKQVGGIVKSVEEMATAAADNSQILNIFRQYGRNMGTVIREHVKNFNTDAIVLGGSISKSYPLFGPDLELQLAEIGCNIPVVLSSLGEKAAILGAAGVFR